MVEYWIIVKSLNPTDVLLMCLFLTFDSIKWKWF